jgi:chitinase
MAFFRRVLGAVAGFAVLQSVYAGLDLSSNSTVVVYWGKLDII